jgi:predicted lipid-binding transport protein (Tim44 family)
MKKWLTFILIALMSISFIYTDAYAKRFGGGRSFGASRSVSNTFSNSAYSRSNAIHQAGNSFKNRWFGPIAGLITGGLLASLFMGHGITGGIFSWILIAVAAMFLLKFLRTRNIFNTQPSTNNARVFEATKEDSNTFYNTSNQASYAQQNNANPQATYTSHLVGEETLRDLKKLFIRLQTAYDQKDIQDIKHFTAPDVFAEIKMQLDERGDAANHTEVMELNANVVDTADGMTSVKFSGQIKENHGSAEHFNEIWHLRKENWQDGWVVTGIQQA